MLPLEVADDDVEESVPVVVAKVCAHACFGFAIWAEGDAGIQPNIGKSRPPLVAKEKVRGHIVGDKQIGIAVFVVVTKYHAELTAAVVINAYFFRHVGKSSISLIAVHNPRRALVLTGTAVDAYRAVPALFVVFEGEIGIVGNVEVEIAIVVDVGKGRTHTQALVAAASGLCHIDKGTIAAIAIQHVGTEVRNIEIHVTVVVIISRADSHAIPFIADTSVLCCFLELPIAFVSI